MIGLKEAAGLIASAILFISSLAVPMADDGTVALESLEGEGTHATAGSPVPIDLDGLAVYDLVTSQGTPVPPASLEGTVDRVSAVSSTTEGPATVVFGQERLRIPPGSRVTIEHVTGTVDLGASSLGSEISVQGTATDLTIEPPEDPVLSTDEGARQGLPVSYLALDGREVQPGFEDAGRFTNLSFSTASLPGDAAGPKLLAGTSALPLEEQVTVEVEQFVGVLAYVRVSDDRLELRLEGYGKVTIAGETIERNVTQAANATLPTTGETNEPPEANFTFRPTTPETGETVSFVDRSEDDLALRDWSWTFGDGDTSTAQHPEHTFPAPGTYDVTLTVTDAAGETDTKTRPVVVVNSRPHVDIEWQPLTPLEGEAVNFTANITDRDDDVTSIEWTFSDGASATGPYVNRSFPDTGAYNVSVLVTDSEGTEDSDAVTVHVRNAPPVPGFLVTPETPVAGEQVTLESTSHDPGSGQIVNWTWELPQSNTAYGEEVEFEFPTDGAASVILTVTDDDGASTSTQRTIDVLNPPPSVSIDADPAYPNPGQDVSFTARIDDDDPPAAAEWIFSDGVVRHGLSIDRSFPSPGGYDVTLLVQDSDGDNGSTERTVQVNHPPDVTLRVVGEGTDVTQTAVLTGASLELEALISDPDGNATSHTWIVDGKRATADDEIRCNREGGEGELLNCTWPDDGQHRIQLLVDDDNGARSTQRLDIIVLNRRPSLSPEVQASVVNVGDPVDIAANAEDPDGTVESIRWFEGSTHLGDGPTLTHTFGSGGAHTLRVNATDDDGGAESVSFTVDVNRPPTMDATASPRDVLAGETVHFDVQDADDPDGDDQALVYRWRFGDGDQAEGLSVDHVYTDSGSYAAKLSVRDEDGGYTNMTFTIRVETPPLNAQLAASPSTPQADEPVTLTVSYDGNRGVDHVEWTLDDGTTRTTQDASITHTYDEPRTYQVSAHLNTEDGAEDTAGLNLRVTGATAHAIEVVPALPDGQCPDLEEDNVEITMESLTTSTKIGLDAGTQTWTVQDTCTLTASIPAGTWSIGDGLLLKGRVGTGVTQGQFDFTTSASLVIDEFLLSNVPLDLRNVTVEGRSNDPLLLEGSEQSTTYHDPLEPVRITGELEWADGSPANGYHVEFTASYNGPRDLLGQQSFQYRSWFTATGQQGSFETLVPAPVLGARAGEDSFTEPGDSSFIYLPGRYDVRVFAASELESDAHRVTFVEDPQGIFEALEGNGAAP